MIKNSSDILIASDAKILVKYTNQGNWWNINENGYSDHTE